jgi:hypothetical protein
LGRFHEGSLDGWLCEGRGEIDEAADLGLLHCPNTDASRLAFRWRPSQVEDLGLLHDVWSAGYPFALNTETGYFYVRAFRGHIVGEGAFQDLRGNPGIYELSFHCPRGLSGAPLVSGRDDQQQLVGVVIGNKSTSMTVFRRTETEKEGATVRELIQDEVMHIGVAIKARSVFAVRFGSLGCTIGEWLSRHGLYGP